MAESQPIRFLRDTTLANPSVSDLNLAQYGGEILAAFDENLVVSKYVRMETITGGRSKEFPALHKMAAERHAAGAPITGQDVATGKRVISLDNRPLIVPWEFDDVDQAVSHFDPKGEISKQAGIALARELDKNAACLLVNASRTTADAGASPFNGGGFQANSDSALTGAAYAVTGSNYATDTVSTLPNYDTGALWGRNHALQLLKMLEDISVSWDDRDIPQEDRKVAVNPSCWHVLRNIGLPTDKATTSTITGFNPFRGSDMGSPTDADASRAAELQYLAFGIFRTPNVPRTNITTGEAKYTGNFTKTRAIAFQKQAIGMLTLMGLKVETGRIIERQVDMSVASMLYGGGALRPECAVEISIS